MTRHVGPLIKIPCSRASAAEFPQGARHFADSITEIRAIFSWPLAHLCVGVRLRILVVLHALYVNRRPLVLQAFQAFLLHSREHARRADACNRMTGKNEIYSIRWLFVRKENFYTTRSTILMFHGGFLSSVYFF